MKNLNLLKSLSLVVAMLISSLTYAQGVRDLRINEVFVKGDQSIVNEMGNHKGWIELYNVGHSNAELGGCKLVMKEANGKETTYTVPKVHGSELPPLGYLVLSLDPTSDAPLTTNFEMGNAVELRLYDASGKGTYLDKVVIDQKMVKANKSLSRPEFESSIKNRRKDANPLKRDVNLELVENSTPGYANYTAPAATRAENFSTMDPSGVGLTLIAMLVVFCALAFLFIVFREVGKAMQRFARRKEGKLCPTVVSAFADTTNLSTEELAAIALAVKLYQDELAHLEKMVLTINRTTKAYSPWSSKIHGLTRLPERKKR